MTGHDFFYIPAQYTRDLHITMSDHEPPVSQGTALESDDMRPCGNFEGDMPLKSFTSIHCKAGAIGQYLYAYLPSTTYLNMCEFEVFGYGKNAPALNLGTLNYLSIGCFIYSFTYGRKLFIIGLLVIITHWANYNK